MTESFTHHPADKDSSVCSDQPDVSVVIVSWNARAFLLECLRSIRAFSGEVKVEIIVVDNASQDGSVEAVETQFREVRLIRNSENMGFAKANNIGISLATGRYLCLINSDVKVLNGCVKNLCEYMDAHPEIGLIGPKILNPDLTIQSSCRHFPSLWNNFCPAVGLDKVFPRSRFFGGEHMFYFPYDRIARVDVIVGCFMMVRRQVLDSVGLLDERFFIYAEDIDWCKRFWKAGWQVMFFPEARAIHHRGGSSSKAPLRFALEQGKAIQQYWKKHHPLGLYILHLLISLLHHSLRLKANLLLYPLLPRKRDLISSQMRQHFNAMLYLLVNNTKNV